MSLAMVVVYDHDYCLHAKCADNADCTEIQFGHNCKCHRGFKGDGVNFCVDIEPPVFQLFKVLRSRNLWKQWELFEFISVRINLLK